MHLHNIADSIRTTIDSPWCI